MKRSVHYLCVASAARVRACVLARGLWSMDGAGGAWSARSTRSSEPFQKWEHEETGDKFSAVFNMKVAGDAWEQNMQNNEFKSAFEALVAHVQANYDFK